MINHLLINKYDNIIKSSNPIPSMPCSSILPHSIGNFDSLALEAITLILALAIIIKNPPLSITLKLYSAFPKLHSNPSQQL